MVKNFKKIIGISFIFLIILTIVFYVFVILTSDISDEELGPSPFKVEESISSENNVEFQEILKIGASIIDITETWRNYEDESPQEYAVRLKNILQKNQHVIDQANPELFFNCKFPNQTMEFNYMPLFNLFALMEKRIVYQILTNDFENAKNNMILSDQIHNNLIEKCTNLILFVIIKIGKDFDLSNIKLMINHESTTLDQKLSILDIEPGLISIQNFIPISYFNEYFIKNKMKNSSSLEINDYSSLPFVNSFVLQPNRSIRYHRDVFMKAFAEFNKPTFNLNTDLKKIILWDSTFEKFYTPNSHGYEIIYKDLSAIEYTVKSVLIYNHYCNQLKLAKKLLQYKVKNGELPITLKELNVDKKMKIDILSEAPFLYSSENGILQSVGLNKINDCVDLTSKIISPAEIRKFLNDENFQGDFILYLK